MYPLIESDQQPIDVFETVVLKSHVKYDRLDANQIALPLYGTWEIYSFGIAWQPNNGCLLTHGYYELPIPKRRRGHIFDLLNSFHGMLWGENFHYNTGDGNMYHRSRIPLSPDQDIDEEQVKAVMQGETAVLDRFYPVILAVAGDSTVDVALKKYLDQTIGRA